MNEGPSGEGDCTLGIASEPELGGVVTPFAALGRKPRRPPPLTDLEIEKMRAIMQQWDQVTQACPIARRTLYGSPQ